MGKQFFHGDIWLHKNVSKRTDAAMAAREKRFKSQHKGNTDEQLLDCVRQCA